MTKNSVVFLAHILESISKIESYTKRIGKEEFFQDSKVQDAVIRRLEVLGEAMYLILRNPATPSLLP